MKITHYLETRCSGKSTFAKQLQMEDPENTLLFSFGEDGTPFQLKHFCGMHPKRVIIDEYIVRYLGNKEKVENWMRSTVIPSIEPNGELILISTPRKMYLKATLILAQVWKSHILLPKNPLFQIKELRDEINEINGSFLNLNEVEIKRNTLSCFLSKEHLQENKMVLDKTIYETQYEAKFAIE